MSIPKSGGPTALASPSAPTPYTSPATPRVHTGKLEGNTHSNGRSDIRHCVCCQRTVGVGWIFEAETWCGSCIRSPRRTDPRPAAVPVDLDAVLAVTA